MHGDFKQANENDIDNKLLHFYIGQDKIIINIAGDPRWIETSPRQKL